MGREKDANVHVDAVKGVGFAILVCRFVDGGFDGGGCDTWTDGGWMENGGRCYDGVCLLLSLMAR